MTLFPIYMYLDLRVCRKYHSSNMRFAHWWQFSLFGPPHHDQLILGTSHLFPASSRPLALPASLTLLILCAPFPFRASKNHDSENHANRRVGRAFIWRTAFSNGTASSGSAFTLSQARMPSHSSISSARRSRGWIQECGLAHFS
jgi:hypothetical protein